MTALAVISVSTDKSSPRCISFVCDQRPSLHGRVRRLSLICVQATGQPAGCPEVMRVLRIGYPSRSLSPSLKAVRPLTDGALLFGVKLAPGLRRRLGVHRLGRL